MNSVDKRTILAAFQQRFGDPYGTTVARAPGRVNLLGEHTDYNDGLVLPMTVDRGVHCALRARNDSSVRLYSVNYSEGIGYQLGSRRPEQSEDARVSWGNYVCGVAEELHKLGLLERGFEGVVSGDLPQGAGLSSSAALTTATALTLQSLFGFELSAADTAKLCQRVEHEYANVQCGIMDQFASRLGRENQALLLDCRSLDYQHVPLPLHAVRVVIIHSGVKRELAGSAYNTRRAECQQAVDALRRRDPAITALRDVSDELLQAASKDLPDSALRRARHVIGENQRVEQAVVALQSKDGPPDLTAFGQLMNASHVSLRDDFQVSCEELDYLVDIAQSVDGVYGARMTGGGFGGCTVNLVLPDAVAELNQRIMDDYPGRFNIRPGFHELRRNFEAGEV